MKANYVLAPLYLAPALAAPVFHTSTVLVAGSSSKTVFVRPGHQAEEVVLDNGAKPFTHPAPSSSSKTAGGPPSSILDADRPLTTEELMALSKTASAPAAPGKVRVKVSVGTLVVPGGAPRGSGGGVPPVFLVPGYYVPAKPADVWVVGLILSFVMVIAGLEIWRPVKRRATCAFLHMKTRSEGPIRLEGAESERLLKSDVEDRAGDDSDDDDDDDDMAPFGGYTTPRAREETSGLRLPERVDEKAGWI